MREERGVCSSSVRGVFPVSSSSLPGKRKSDFFWAGRRRGKMRCGYTPRGSKHLSSMIQTLSRKHNCPIICLLHTLLVEVVGHA